MGRRDIFNNSVGYNYQMYFSKRNEEYNDSSVYDYSDEKIGPLACRIYTPMTKEKDIIDMQFNFDKDGTTVKTLDNASDMKAGDRAYIMGKNWLVSNIQTMPYQNNSEYDKAPSCAYYISLKGA